MTARSFFHGFVALAVCALLGGANAAELQAPINRAPPVEVQVPARAEAGHEWIHTGQRVVTNTVITFQASGRATHNPEVGYSSADGNLRTGLASRWTKQYGPALLEDAPLGALVGKIGENGAPFLIGQRLTLTATNQGALFIGFNECLGQSKDNEGLFAVRISLDGALPMQSPRGPGAYAKDVEFLLAELPQRAARLLKIKGIDWAKVSADFREQVKAVQSDADHVKLCRRLVARLRDGHAYLAGLQMKLPDESQGRRWTGPHVHLLVSGEKVYVRQAFGNASSKGVQVGMEVVRIDGPPARQWLDARVVKMRDENGYSTDHQALYAACHWGLADWSGTSIELELRSGADTKKVTLIRSGGANIAPFGPLFPPKDLQRIGRQTYGKTQNRFGYIHLRDVPGNLPEQLDTMLAALGNVPGLILDLRANGGGGTDHSAVFGRFVGTGETWKDYRSAGKDPFAGPLVVIVDPGTRSAGETVAAMLKEDGRAYLIGEGPTAGTSSSKEDLKVPSGLFTVHFSVASNMRRVNGGRGLEGIGVAPHEVIPYDPSELLRGIDSPIRRAEELLRQGVPADKVPFLETLKR